MALGGGNHSPGQVRVGGRGGQRHQLRRWEACPGGGPREDSDAEPDVKEHGASCERANSGAGAGKGQKPISFQLCGWSEDSW